MERPPNPLIVAIRARFAPSVASPPLDEAGEIALYERRSVLWIPGLVIALAGAAGGGAGLPLWLCAAVVGAGAAVFAAGLCYYARSRGRSHIAGLVAAWLAGPVALAILFTMEDRTHGRVPGRPAYCGPRGLRLGTWVWIALTGVHWGVAYSRLALL